MLKAVGHSARLLRGFWTLSRAGAGLPSVLRKVLPLPLRLVLPKKHRKSKKNPAPLAKAFSTLGPTYIKLGQFIAVRRDILDENYIDDLSHLHDKLPPFPQKKARQMLKDNFGENPFDTFSRPIAAASIAQVHQAAGHDGKTYAVKLLRPGIEKKFQSDIESLLWAAHKVERSLKDAKRLRPVAALKNLENTTLREMDLRLEAAAISQIKENNRLKEVYIPQVAWQWTRERVLTMEWIDGTPLSDRKALEKTPHDKKALARTLLQSFLYQALYDGFFHADIHPGNLILRDDGVLVPIDFGITGSLPRRDRHAMVWILRGLIDGDYELAAREHIAVGYVPKGTSLPLFAQALRAIGEPLRDKQAQDISMADVLWQLFETARKFEMETQPQLLLLQKTMMASEGLARSLDPHLNIWEIARPLVEAWVKHEYSPERLLRPEAIRQGLRYAQGMGERVLQALEKREDKTTPAPAPARGAAHKKNLWRALFWLLLGVGVGIGGGIALTKFYPNYAFFM